MQNFNKIKELSRKYKVPKEDILLIGLNCCGVDSDASFVRIRFNLKLKTVPHEKFHLCVPVLRSETPFYLSCRESKLYFNGEVIGEVTNVENDTSDPIYFRRRGTVLTLNSNSRSSCTGCKFCGNVLLEPKDRYDLTSKDNLMLFLQEFCKKFRMSSLSHVIQITLSTGCFDNEKEVLEHLLMIKEVFSYFGFTGEIRYIGCEIRTEEGLNLTRNSIKSFALCLSVECFTRREWLLKESKRISLNQCAQILQLSREKGFGTHFIYIAGLDPINEIKEGFKKLLPLVNRFPVINIFQPYTEAHKGLRNDEGWDIEYYLKVRKCIEELVEQSNLRPNPWENYRPLWYLTFKDRKLKGIRI